MVDITAIRVHKVNFIENVTAHINPFTANRDYCSLKKTANWN